MPKKLTITEQGFTTVWQRIHGTGCLKIRVSDSMGVVFETMCQVRRNESIEKLARRLLPLAINHARHIQADDSDSSSVVHSSDNWQP